MHPDAESPVGGSDEVGVVVGDAEVVDGFDLAAVEHVLDGDPAAGRFRGKEIADFQFTRRRPALVFVAEFAKNSAV